MGITSITGKVELVYEGEEGAAYAQNLIASAIHTFGYFLKSRS
jgi:hypothetical protein